jgi:hypothetical protein
MSSSFPSTAFIIPVKKLFIITFVDFMFPALTVQSYIISVYGLHIFPVGIYSCPPSAIHCVYTFLTLPLNALINDTLRGCKTDINPPGMNARRVFISIRHPPNAGKNYPTQVEIVAEAMCQVTDPELCRPNHTPQLHPYNPCLLQAHELHSVTWFLSLPSF